MSKRVAIIGAGPAGLAAAKTLLHTHPSGTFLPTVFEQAASVGGLWPVSEVAPDSIANPHLTTNLSQYSVSFSDLAWESAELDQEPVSNSTTSTGQFVPLFPRAWQVGQYLQTYARRFLPPDCIKLKSKVVRASREPHRAGHRWRVDWQRQETAGPSTEAIGTGVGAASPISTAYYDYLIVASGFFSRPTVPRLPGLDRFQGKLLHSSQYRDLADLGEPTGTSSSEPAAAGRKIVVVGGSTSGPDIAATIALHLATARSGPSRPVAESAQLWHVTARPFWAPPTLLARDPLTEAGQFNAAPSFLPFDVSLYELSKYPENIKASPPPVSPEMAKMFNGIFATQAGRVPGDQEHPALSVDDGWMTKPPYVAITDRYVEFVRSGHIKPIRGRVTAVKESSTSVDAVQVKDGSKEFLLDDVDCIVFATGFSPRPALDFLAQDVLKTLGYDESCENVPLLLHQATTNHPAIPDLGFVGLYQGAFWGVIEMQARYLARRWTGQVDPDQEVGRPATELRRISISTDARPQFIMGDYVGLVEEFASVLGVTRRPIQDMGHREGPATPARYLTAEQGTDEADKTLASLHRLVAQPPPSTSLVARATFFGLQGQWRISRTIKSALTSYPSGRFTGEANFHPRDATADGFSEEYLYEEEGTMTTESGSKIEGSMRYVYRYREDEDRLSAWFVKTDGSRGVDRFFHGLHFTEASETEGWRAGGQHFCDPDDYEVQYRFKFRGVNISSFTIDYQVRGPKKDYTTHTSFCRPAEAADGP